MVIKKILTELAGRALEEVMFGKADFSVEAGQSVIQASTMILKNATLLNLNKIDIIEDNEKETTPKLSINSISFYFL